MIFDDSADVIMAGQGIPRGRAAPEEGGYRLSGQYSYGSGIAHAEYVYTGALVMDGDRPRLTPDGSPEMRLFHVARRDVELGDNWLDVKQMARLRLGLRYVHEVVSEVCTFAYRAGGGVSLRTSVLQRCYRDIHAATQHILMSDQITQACGKALLGLAPEGAKWTLAGLG